MTMIQKMVTKRGEQVSEAAAAAVKNIKNAIRREFIPNDKLVRQPASDLYEIAKDMKDPAFWEDYHNQSMFLLGNNLWNWREFPEVTGIDLRHMSNLCADLKDYVAKQRNLAAYRYKAEL